MKKRDIQIILIIIVFALLSFGGFKYFEGEVGNSNYVVISVDGEEYKRVSLTEPQTVIIDKNGRHNEIKITENGVYVKNANCDNQDCILQGEANLQNIEERIMGGWIVCLPNKVSIELVKGDIQ